MRELCRLMHWHEERLIKKRISCCSRLCNSIYIQYIYTIYKNSILIYFCLIKPNALIAKKDFTHVFTAQAHVCVIRKWVSETIYCIQIPLKYDCDSKTFNFNNCNC